MFAIVVGSVADDGCTRMLWEVGPSSGTGVLRRLFARVGEATKLSFPFLPWVVSRVAGIHFVSLIRPAFV